MEVKQISRREVISNQVIALLPASIRDVIERNCVEYEHLQEIRLRTYKPLMIMYKGEEVLLKTYKDEYIVQPNEIAEFMQYISNYSLYAYENELREGFITLEGGHRVGVAGKVHLENGKVNRILYIGSVNIRIAHEIIGCADKIMDQIYRSNEECLYNTLIVAPPVCGKTTLLRDIVRHISNGDSRHKGQNVSIVDERSEIAACYKGIPMNDMGVRTDVLDGCPKEVGFYMLLRTMSPKVIAIDEIGCNSSFELIRNCVQCGVSVVATIHGADVEEASCRSRVLRELMKEKVFSRYVVLSYKDGVRSVNILNKEGMKIYGY